MLCHTCSPQCVPTTELSLNVHTTAPERPNQVPRGCSAPPRAPGHCTGHSGSACTNTQTSHCPPALAPCRGSTGCCLRTEQCNGERNGPSQLGKAGPHRDMRKTILTRPREDLVGTISPHLKHSNAPCLQSDALKPFLPAMIPKIMGLEPRDIICLFHITEETRRNLLYLPIPYGS